MERGRRSDLERPTFGEELFDELGLDVAGFVPPPVTPLRITGGLPSQPSGVLLSDQLLCSDTFVVADEVATFLACFRKPKLIFGILLPNPPPPLFEVLLALFESDMVSLLFVLLLLFVFVWRGEEERDGQLLE